MLKSLAYWVQATNMARFTRVPKGQGLPFEITDTGELVAEHDPFLEDSGTLWLLQYELASNRAFAPLWYWTFNLLRNREFTDESLVQGLMRFVEEQNLPSIATESAKRDVRCFKRTYAPSTRTEQAGYREDLLDCPLAELGLIKESSYPGSFSLRIGPHPSLPLGIFGYAVFRYRETYAEGQATVSLDDLRWAPGSPGRVFCLDTGNALELLEDLERETHLVRVTRSEGVSQVSFSGDLTSAEVLERYYLASETRSQ